MARPRAAQACPVHRCPNLQPCPDHHTAQDNRPSAGQRGYGHHWRTHIRAPFLAAHPTCIDCGQPSQVPDHHPHTRRQLIAAGVENPDGFEHLVPRCWSCHSRKTAEHDGAFGNARKISSEPPGWGGTPSLPG